MRKRTSNPLGSSVGPTGDALWRLFVAVFPDEAALDALAPVDRWLKRFGSHRIIPRRQRHLTLAFVGDITPSAIGPLQSTLAKNAGHFSPFRAPFTGITAFPSSTTPRVIAVALEPAPPMRAFLRSALDSVAQAAPTDTVLRDLDRDTQPHITVARTRRASRARQIDLNTAPTPPGALFVTNIAIVRSTLSPTGPLYHLIATVTLGKPHETPTRP